MGPLLILVFFVSLSYSIFHWNARLVAVYDGAVADEAHALVLGTRHLDPFGEEPVSTARVGETTRWFVRLLYPAGIFYMNGRMGGEVRTLTAYEHPGGGYQYPGGYYLEKHYSSYEAKKDRRKNVSGDPNIQDFLFAMRISFALLAAGCFCLALWALFRRFGPAAVAVYGGLVLGNSLVLNEFRTFYSEMTMFVLFNLAVFLCCKRRMSTYRRTAYLGILAAAALSTKPTGLMIAAAAFAYVVAFEARESGPEGRRGVGLRIETFLLSALVSLVVINLPVGSFFAFVNDTLANVYKYKTGKSGIAHGEGIEMLHRYVRAAGYGIFALFGAGVLWLLGSPKRRELAPVYVLCACIVLIVWSLAGSAWYHPRTLASTYVAMSFVVALCVGQLVRTAPEDDGRRPLKTWTSFALVLVFLAVSISPAWRLPSLGGVFFEQAAGLVADCGSVGAIGLPDGEVARLQGAAKAGVAAFPGVRAPFVVADDHERLVEALPRLRNAVRKHGNAFRKFWEYDCLAVRREGHTKQVTNFHAARRGYELRVRVGERFLFVRR